MILFLITFKFLLLIFKDYHFSFLTLSEILFAFNHFTRCVKSGLTILFSFLIELLRHNRLMSSAKWWTLQNFIAWFRSFIYNKHRRGPRTDPWGTPQFIAENAKYHARWKQLHVTIQFLHGCHLLWSSYSKSLISNSCTFSIFPALEMKKLVLLGKILWRFDNYSIYG